MPTRQPLHFDQFQLDPGNASLLRDGQPLPLTPKAFDVLVCLCERPGRLVAKEELLDAVWQRRFVSEGALKNTIQELRRALGDDPKAPRYIETVHGRGYRFVGATGAQATPSPAADQVHRAAADPDIVVGREMSLDRLRELLGLSLAGQPQTVFLSGEAGVGKTTLMRCFSAQLPENVVPIGGQCVAQYGEVEPYLPLLEALNRLARGHGPELTGALRRYAPTWLAQLPWLFDDADRNALGGQGSGLAKERMQRELGAFLEHWTCERSRALVLLLEDLHWSDHATLDAIAYLARRRGPGRWMILGSYRPVDLLMNEHPLRRAMGELRLHQLCHDIGVQLLSEQEVVAYLGRRFAGNPLSEPFMRAVSRRTEGLPLYLVHLSNELMAWREQHPRSTEQELESFFETLPESLKLFVEQQLSRVPADCHAFLDAAAVAGSGFSAAMLAAATAGDILAAEEWCERLAGDRHIFTHAGPPHHPERRRSGRYAFVHAYYQKLAYDRVPMLRRASLHLSIAEWFEASCQTRVRDLAAEIAMHFEQGRSYQRALHYFRIAVENALGRHEPHAVAASARRALTILEHHLPATPAHARIAVELYTVLATAVQVTHGWAEPALQSIFERLLQHEQSLDESPHRLSILWALMGFHFVCGQLHTAEQYAGQILASARGDCCQDVLISGHVGRTGGGLYTGRVDLALEHFQAGQALYGPEQRGLFPLMAIHPVVLGHFFAAQAHWLRGLPDQALRCAEQGMAIARADAQPFSVAFSEWGAIICHQMRGEAGLAAESCATLVEHADEQGFALLSALALTLQGWSLASLGRVQAGAASMWQGVAAFRATGARLSETYLLASCVDALLRAGLLEDGAVLLEEAFALMEQTGERHFEAELQRLKGETVRTSAPDDAERWFRCALKTAQRQGARSLALRAAMSLARLGLEQSRFDSARSLLQACYATFTEGFDTRDLREARDLLEAMNDEPGFHAAWDGSVRGAANKSSTAL